MTVLSIAVGSFLLCGVLLLGGGALGAAESRWRIAERSVVDHVWAGHPVGFAFLTHGDRQFLAYYNAARDTVFAQRTLPDGAWQRFISAPKTGWDSHNYLTMAIDSAGYVHASGNMHCVPLIYYRSAEPLDVSDMRRIPHMTGEDEGQCTYPQFIKGPTTSSSSCTARDRAATG